MWQHNTRPPTPQFGVAYHLFIGPFLRQHIGSNRNFVPVLITLSKVGHVWRIGLKSLFLVYWEAMTIYLSIYISKWALLQYRYWHPFFYRMLLLMITMLVQQTYSHRMNSLFKQDEHRSSCQLAALAHLEDLIWFRDPLRFIRLENCSLNSNWALELSEWLYKGPRN